MERQSSSAGSTFSFDVKGDQADAFAFLTVTRANGSLEKSGTRLVARIIVAAFRAKGPSFSPKLLVCLCRSALPCGPPRTGALHGWRGPGARARPQCDLSCNRGDLPETLERQGHDAAPA